MPNVQQDSWLVFADEFLHPCVSFVVVHAKNMLLFLFINTNTKGIKIIR